MKQFSDVEWLWKEGDRRLKGKGIIRQYRLEGQLLWKYCTLTSGGIVEIGTAHGGGTAILLEVTSHTNRNVSTIDKTLTTIDESCKIVFEENKDRLTVITERSENAVIDHSYDLLFVDGDHSYKGVKGDMERFIPDLEIGGIIVFHDYGPRVEKHESSYGKPYGGYSLTKAVDEWADLGRIKLLEVVRSSAAFQKLC
jgi:predicted O-methyltransferase YrrM